MSPHGLDGGGRHQRFPRVSGDEPNCYALDTPKIAFSPRERG